MNAHLGHLGIEAHSHQELVEQLGTLRDGHRPRVGDTFCGGGSIPFEAARLGCGVHASDLNPIACMLTWGALNIIGASPEKRAEIERAQREVAEAAHREDHGARYRARQPGEPGQGLSRSSGDPLPGHGPWCRWRRVGLSQRRAASFKLVPDHGNKRFDIQILTGVSAADMKAAEQGTVRDGNLVYELERKTYRTPIKTLRGDYRDADGNIANRLRRWVKNDFKPRADDIFQERLYCIQWITRQSLDRPRPETFFWPWLLCTSNQRAG